MVVLEAVVDVVGIENKSKFTVDADHSINDLFFSQMGVPYTQLTIKWLASLLKKWYCVKVLGLFWAAEI